MSESKKQVQKATTPGGGHPSKELPKGLGSEPPKRGTGRQTGTAKEPTGPDDRLTEEERKKRHKEKFG